MKPLSEKVKEILSSVFEISVQNINEDFCQNDTASWDSIKHLNLIIILEEEFGIQINDNIIPELTSYSQILNFISKYQ